MPTSSPARSHDGVRPQEPPAPTGFAQGPDAADAGVRLVAARTAAGMTQEQVALRMWTQNERGVAPESGRYARPTLDTIQKYASPWERAWKFAFGIALDGTNAREAPMASASQCQALGRVKLVCRTWKASTDPRMLHP